MKGTTFLVMGLIIGVALASNPLVVIGDNEKHILDSSALAQHMAQNEQVKSFIVDSSLQGSDLVQTVKKVLESANISKTQTDSFLISIQEFNQVVGPILQKFEQVTAEELPQAVVYFRNRASEARLLQTVNTNSQLFTNMTPSVLSGLFVALFLIIMLLIGIGCLYSIKTNDKFARNPLWVGKES